MSITQEQHEQNIENYRIFLQQQNLIDNNDIPYTNGYYNCPCGSAVKNIRRHFASQKHDTYITTTLPNQINFLYRNINLYNIEQEQRQREEQKQREEEDEEEEEAKDNRCHICSQEANVCTCADEYIHYKSFYGIDDIEDIDDKYNDEFIELYQDIKNVNMTDNEDIEEFVKNNEDIENLMKQGEHIDFIDTEETHDIKNELVKSTNISPDICNIIAEYATGIKWEDFYNQMVEDDKIEIKSENLSKIELYIFNGALCLVFQSINYRDDHYCYDNTNNHLYLLNYIGEDEYGEAKYSRQSNRPISVKDFTIMDYGYNHFIISYKD
jgi:hypothetical protein